MTIGVKKINKIRKKWENRKDETSNGENDFKF